MRKEQLTARSPGKLILTGEHAVVYGQPAIALAVNCYAESTISARFAAGIFFNLLNLRYAKSLTLGTLSVVKERILSQYASFLEGDCSIREVLKKPFELMQFTVSHILESLCVPLSEGIEVRSLSSIPMGCGMGSSAAAVMSTLFVIAKFFNLELEPFRFLSLGKEAENLQHGRSSGIDLQLAMSGGCLRFQNGQIKSRVLPFPQLTLVHTGVPEARTGECIEVVAPHFKDIILQEEFGAVAEQFDLALIQQDLPQIQLAIRENHKLLVRIGVVPRRVQDFIGEIEGMQGAAKICGAGSVRGQAGGVVLVMTDQDISPLVKRYGYTTQIVKSDLEGTRLV